MPIPADAPALRPPDDEALVLLSVVPAVAVLLAVLEDVAEDVDEVVDEDDSPNTCLPPARSSPRRLNVALFAPSLRSVSVFVRRLNQHGVSDVKLSRIGTVALKPGAFCW